MPPLAPVLDSGHLPARRFISPLAGAAELRLQAHASRPKGLGAVGGG
jgi:hypothetical protein